MRFETSLLFLWSSLEMVTFSWNSRVLDRLAVHRGSRVAVRFDKFEWAINNEYGRVNQVYVSQSNGSDLGNVAMTFDFEFVLQQLTVEIFKCKEHYIDCVNYRSFGFTRFCGHENAILLFIKLGYVDRELSCTIKQGLYTVKNVTLNVDNVVGPFALSLEKWWEKTWIWNITFFADDDAFIMRSNGQLRFLMLKRSRSNGGPAAPVVGGAH
ncbi:uncharacterized protein LOC126898466 [Daktulosphaira vitifoliae]|uniref:uncharacterized protein LOC126898466 n=1 Tax=Daktulosphaira vitifoliae TaxID=58002 RepID=UPI0021A9C596|nr:uncharacterized protein LOC126898466 [Daktulosphaira vitifoliae]